MPIWKRNLFVCWIGVFIAAIGMSEVAPILPLYIRHLGIQNTSLVSQLSGITFGSTYLITAIFSPIWGYAADKVGRKPMILRAGIGLSIVYLLMGFAPNVYFLIALSMIQGGYHRIQHSLQHLDCNANGQGTCRLCLRDSFHRISCRLFIRANA